MDDDNDQYSDGDIKIFVKLMRTNDTMAFKYKSLEIEQEFDYLS